MPERQIINPHMKKAFYIILVLALIAAVTAFILYTRVYNKPHTDVFQEPARYEMSAPQLLEEFRTDEPNANKQYLDQIVQVTGTIRSIETANGLSIITLGSEEDLGGVICNMDPAENKRVLHLEIGQVLEAKGICTGYLLDVILVRSVIVNQI